MRHGLLAAFVSLLVIGPSSAQPLPGPDAVDWPALRDHARELLKGLDSLKASLPDATAKRLRDLLDKTSADPDEAALAVQELLDPLCLVAVTINPESRVKVARGIAAPELQRDRPTVLLVKVVNDGGVTHGLAVEGPEVITAREKNGRWLEAKVADGQPWAGRLTGRKLEYAALVLTPREGGKREATLRFDVGQGTQDLGFRAEVPILFSVRTR